MRQSEGNVDTTAPSVRDSALEWIRQAGKEGSKEGWAAAVIDGTTPPRFVEGDIAEEQISIIRGEKTSESIPALTFCDTCDVGGALV